jgi:hypothetical protein
MPDMSGLRGTNEGTAGEMFDFGCSLTSSWSRWVFSVVLMRRWVDIVIELKYIVVNGVLRVKHISRSPYWRSNRRARTSLHRPRGCK